MHRGGDVPEESGQAARWGVACQEWEAETCLHAFADFNDLDILVLAVEPGVGRAGS